MIRTGIDLREIDSAQEAFQQAPVLVKAKLRTAIKKASEITLKSIKGNIRARLSRRSGELLRSFDRIPVQETDKGVDGGVRSTSRYARFQDLGFSGAETVKSYSRTSPNGTITVKAHSRNVRYQGKAFVRDGVVSSESGILKQVKLGVSNAIASIRERVASGRSLNPRDR